MRKLGQLCRPLLGWPARLALALVLPACALLCMRNFQVLEHQQEATTRLAALEDKVTVETPGYVFVGLREKSPTSGTAELEALDWRGRQGVTLTWREAALLGFLFLVGLSRPLMSRWPVILIVAGVITCGIFSAVNNEFVRVGVGTGSSAGDAPNLYRAKFYQRFGYDPVTSSRGETLENDAKVFIDATEELKTVVRPQGKGTLLAIPELGLDSAANDATRLKLLLKQDDRVLTGVLERHFGIRTRLWPRSSSTWTGYSDPYAASVTRTPWQHAPVGTPSYESLQKMLRSIADPAKAGTPTNPPPGLSLLAKLHRQEMDELQNVPAAAVARRLNGLFQWVTIFCFVVGILLIVARYYRGVTLVRRSLNRWLPKPTTDKIVSPPQVRAAWSELDRERDEDGFRGDGVKELVYVACQTLSVSNSQQEAREALDSAAERLFNRVDVGYGIVNYCVWLIPALGFAGTTFFLSMALFEARLLGEGDVMQGLQRTMASLGLKFDTTFVALCNAIILLFAATIVRGREEAAIDAARDRVNYDLICRFVADAPSEPASPGPGPGGSTAGGYVADAPPEPESPTDPGPRVAGVDPSTNGVPSDGLVGRHT